jgi:RNA 3'-terminal phosphate cyclase (ATP)
MKTASTNSCEIHLDGSTGEGGGQILRSALSLSAITGRSFRLESIRAGRKRPGLMRQHLTCVQATSVICGGRTSDIRLGSESLSFWPGEIAASQHTFSIGTAGSTGLLLQTILPVLLHAPESSKVILQGGTHVIQAPVFEYIAEVFLPNLRRLGAKAEVSLARHGFFPAGAGQVELVVKPSSLIALDFPDSKPRMAIRAEVLSTPEIAESVAAKEIRAVRQAFNLSNADSAITLVKGAACAGNALLIRAQGDGAGTLCCSLGEHGKPARQVAKKVSAAMRRYLGSPASIDEHLADQLLLPLALAGGGSFTAVALTPHFHSNVEVIEAFLPVKIVTEEIDRFAHRVAIKTT